MMIAQLPEQKGREQGRLEGGCEATLKMARAILQRDWITHPR